MNIHIDRLPLICVSGHWRHGQGEAILTLVNPATAQAFAQYQAAGDDDIARAEKELDALTKTHVDAIDDALKRKEAELLEV